MRVQEQLTRFGGGPIVLVIPNFQPLTDQVHQTFLTWKNCY